ncbi:MAG TPA: ScyD/ScyE family protein [Solirubrobacteraceae bacterium]|nr:ScyD/ScyE family protein [Solirubrobacteraceae bacterium]
MRRGTKLGALAAGLALFAAAPASAHHPKGVDVDTIVGGLDNPRHVAVAKDGGVWVAESGRGAPAAESNSCFETAEGASCTGDSGAITRINRRGVATRVVTSLASFAPAGGNTAIGPYGIFADGNDIYFTNGGPTGPLRPPSEDIVLRDPTLVSEEPVSRFYGTLRKVERHGGHRKIADLWRFENENNPDAEVANPLVDSNPVDVYADHGRFYVADAGGNSVLRVGRFGGIRPLAIFENRDVDDPFNPDPDGDPIPMQAVPTGVVKGPDGALYVSQLTGFPFPVGGANVYRLDPRGGEPTVYASGFTNIIDLDFGKDGTLYVLEIDNNGLLDPPDQPPTPEGALFSVSRRGTVKQVELPPGTLTHPGGVAVGRRGDVYVTNRSTEAGTGEVLRIDLD